MANREKPTPGFSAWNRFAIALNVALSVVAVVALVAMVNYLAGRHFRRWHLNQRSQALLTPETQRVLAAVTNEVRVVVMFDRDNPLFGLVMGLLKEYSNQCPRLTIEHVDYKRDLERAQTLIARHQLPPTESDLVIVETRGRARLVREPELSDYDLSGLLTSSREVRRVSFKGEALLTAAIAGLLDARVPRTYYLQGHGEHDLASTETKFGYSRFAQLLAHKNIEALPLRLTGETEVPDDCQMLLIAGPRSKLGADEVERIGRYLNRGGRLFAMLSLIRSNQGDTGLEPLLGAWGVSVGRQYLFDRNNAVVGGGILCTNFSAHPIVKPLWGDSLYVVLARSIDPTGATVPSADAPRVENLMSTSVDGFAASGMSDAGLPILNPARDRRGIIPLAVAVDKGSIRGVAADRSATRLVVVGESIFLANETIFKATANLDFANLAVSWLLDRPTQLAGIPPRPLREFNITLSRASLWHLAWVLLVAMPGVPLVIGLAVWLRRRR